MDALSEHVLNQDILVVEQQHLSEDILACLPGCTGYYAIQRVDFVRAPSCRGVVGRLQIEL